MRNVQKCPKCDGWVQTRFSVGHTVEPHGRRTDEHMDHLCLSCGFEWEGDCLDARLGRVAAPAPPP